MKHLTLLLICVAIASGIQAQRLQTPTLSPFTEISQQAGLTNIKLSYARPSAKGRKVFGELVPYGEVWRTGANASTKISVTETVSVGGHKLDSGMYALYTIPGADQWTIIIHAKTNMRSIAGDAYKPENDVFRFVVTPKTTAGYIETFTLQFADIKTDNLKLRLAWANTVVDIPIAVEVDDKIEAQMTEFLKTPDDIPAGTYFEAAQYYLHNDKDLGDALSWINAALVKSPENFRYGLLKAKIQEKSGDHKAALATIEQANGWATAANNANYIGQTQLYWDSIK